MAAQRKAIPEPLRNQILDLWALGKKAPYIKEQFGVTVRDVENVIRFHRKRGDERAKRHWKRGGTTGRVLPNEFAFTPTQLENMHRRFVKAMLAAIKAGLENPPIGTYRFNRNSQPVIGKVFSPVPRFSGCGSAAAMCAEIAR